MHAEIFARNTLLANIRMTDPEGVERRMHEIQDLFVRTGVPVFLGLRDVLKSRDEGQEGRFGLRRN